MIDAFTANELSKKALEDIEAKSNIQKKYIQSSINIAVSNGLFTVKCFIENYAVRDSVANMLKQIGYEVTISKRNLIISW